MSETREIILGSREQYITTVDEEDYQFLIKWRWNYKVSRGGNVYARRGGGKGRPTILMHNVIMERMGYPRPSEKYTVHHLNNNSLDNRRANLGWALSTQQNKYRKRKKKSVDVAAVLLGDDQ